MFGNKDQHGDKPLKTKTIEVQVADTGHGKRNAAIGAACAAGLAGVATYVAKHRSNGNKTADVTADDIPSGVSVKGTHHERSYSERD